MTAPQPEPHLALIVEDDPDLRALAAVLLEVASADAAMAVLSREWK